MKKTYSIYFFLISSLLFSQEIVKTSEFSTFNFHSIQEPFQPNQTILDNPFSVDKYNLPLNEYSLVVPKIQVKKPITFYLQDNFTGAYTLYTVSDNYFRSIQTYANFYEFDSGSTIQPFNYGSNGIDFGTHILSSLVSTYKITLIEGCK